MSYLLDAYISNFNAVSNLGGLFTLPAGGEWAYGDHNFSQNKFYLISQGNCVINIEGTDVVAQAGDWLFIPAGTVHRYHNDTDKRFGQYWMHFDVYPNNELFHLLKLPYMVKVPKGHKVYRLFRQYAKLSESRQLLDKIQVKSLLVQLLGAYVELALPNELQVTGIRQSKIDEVLRYINNNIDKPLTVAELAQRFHLHETHFIRFFKNEVGQTPARYVKQKKMETAKRYLESSDLYITEIMEKVGESDSAVFSKQFKSCFGFSPRRYRKWYQAERQESLTIANKKQQ
ncbi:MAG: helix-turn-helix domain-containing protein [Clostridia bacterium]|nr:helix-turn-helix domain-containing protein [Clostridia bacterium]